jgi:hypothetical protein
MVSKKGSGLGPDRTVASLQMRATTLATTSFRVLLATAAKFDLETLQLDALNTFVYADIDEYTCKCRQATEN